MKIISEIAQSKSHGNEVVQLFLASFVEKSYLTLQLTLHSQKCLANCWLCVLDADAHAHSDARSDAEERPHVPQFPRSDNHEKVPQSVCQATIFLLYLTIHEVCFLIQTYSL